jgi:uncharacterized protein YgbK (DUF1537 family)
VTRAIQVGIQADDLTGACDAGAPFAARGLETIVLLPGVAVPDSPPAVVVIDTESRGSEPGPARAQARKAVARLAAAGPPRFLYKKIDSTLRGPLAAEVAGALEGAGLPAVLLTPAFPAERRVVVDGQLRIDGLPADETPLGRDPAFPATGASVAALPGVDGPHPAGVVPLVTVRRGPEAVAARLDRGLATYVADAETDEDLAVLREAATGRRLLLAGSAGLAGVLAGSLGRPAPRAAPRPRRPLLVVAGSAHPVTRLQVERLAARGVPRMETRGAAAIPDTATGASMLAVPPDEPIAPPRPREAVAAELAVAARRVVEASRTRDVGDWAAPTLVLTGGETAVAVCRALGATAIALRGELEPGLPHGTLLDGPFAGLAVVTKAGGFGDPDALVRLWESAS